MVRNTPVTRHMTEVTSGTGTYTQAHPSMEVWSTSNHTIQIHNEDEEMKKWSAIATRRWGLTEREGCAGVIPGFTVTNGVHYKHTDSVHPKGHQVHDGSKLERCIS